jgi:hypothetical protein
MISVRQTSPAVGTTCGCEIQLGGVHANVRHKARGRNLCGPRKSGIDPVAPGSIRAGAR